MKKIKISFLAIISFMAFSCQDFIDTEPFSFVSVDNFYKTPSEVELALTGVYNVLSANEVGQGFGNNSTFSRNLMLMLNGATDEVLGRDNSLNPDYVVWGNATFTAQSNFLNEAWIFLYSGIARANYLIERIEPVEGFQGDRKKEIIAEARFLRGFYHMMLSMMHGGIPLVTSTNENPKKPRNSIQEVYKQIIEDYEFAYNNLKNRAAMPSRVNKWTAAGFLAKAHTYLASNKVSKSNSFITINSFDWVDSDLHYSKALSYTEDIIANSGYQLIPNYDYLFRESTKKQQYQETLLSAEASSNSTVKAINLLSYTFTPLGNVNVTGGGYGWFRPTHELYALYNSGDFRRNHNLTGNINNTNNVEIIEGVRYYAPRPIPNTNVAFYCTGKYRTIDPAAKTIPNWASNINLPILRYADILLLHAEALYFKGNEAEARDVLSEIRKRVVLNSSSLEQLNDAYRRDNFLDELLEERSRELCFESWRRIDLARFNRFNQTIENMSTTEGFYNKAIVPTIKSNWMPERVWLPIPIIQIDLNPNLIQNQGY